MSVANTPPEILGLIFDHFASSPRTLGICSLVCKGWLSSARYQLFKTVVLHFGRRSDYVFVHDLLQNAFCTFTASVRNLWILPNDGVNLGSEETKTELALLQRLVGVRTLRLHYPKTIPGDTLRVIATALKDIACLDMRLRFGSFADALRFVGLFPRLEDLHFEQKWTPTGDMPPDDLPIAPTLRTLYLSSIRGHERWFADHRPTTLTTLSVDAVRPNSDIPRLDEMLLVFGRDLRRLTIRFSNQKGDLDLGVNLSSNTELRYLEIDLSELTKKHVFPVVQSLNARNLETFVWRNRTSFDESDISSWTNLDALLTDRERFRALGRFKILPPKGNTQAFDARTRMPLCHERGMFVS